MGDPGEDLAYRTGFEIPEESRKAKNGENKEDHLSTCIIQKRDTENTGMRCGATKSVARDQLIQAV
jgi:hypothetical protein